MRDAALSFDTKKPSSPSQHVFPKKSGLGSWTIREWPIKNQFHDMFLLVSMLLLMTMKVMMLVMIMMKMMMMMMMISLMMLIK